MDLSGQLYGLVALSAREKPRYKFRWSFGGSQTVGREEEISAAFGNRNKYPGK